MESGRLDTWQGIHSSHRPTPRRHQQSAADVAIPRSATGPHPGMITCQSCHNSPFRAGPEGGRPTRGQLNSLPAQPRAEASRRQSRVRKPQYTKAEATPPRDPPFPSVIEWADGRIAPTTRASHPQQSAGERKASKPPQAPQQQAIIADPQRRHRTWPRHLQRRSASPDLA